MSWKIIEKYRRILAAEKGATPNNWGGEAAGLPRLPEPLPDRHEQPRFQAVYELLNARPDMVCERAFLPDMDTEIAAIEARRDKTRALKQGMMQELLTGRIRPV